MKLNLKRPLAFFDLETTGISITQDRIVELSVIKLDVDGTETVKTTKVNPTIPISTESSLIHGIYDEDVKDAPTFKQIAKSLDDFLEGCDLGGYNLAKFDVPLLVEEFLRIGIDFKIDGRNIVDAQKIFYMMQPRTLSAAYEFFCGKELNNAHSAEADTRATMEVLIAQVQKYEGVKIKDKEGNLIDPVKNDMAVLHELSMGKLADLAGRLAFNSEGEIVYNFGKHNKKPVKAVFDEEPSYYNWIMKGDFPLQTKNVLTKLKLESFNAK